MVNRLVVDFLISPVPKYKVVNSLRIVRPTFKILVYKYLIYVSKMTNVDARRRCNKECTHFLLEKVLSHGGVG